MSDQEPSEGSRRFDHLATSSSGMHYVKERVSGVMRALTESELADFQDPPPCPSCAEQFGCEHFNCAGEAILVDDAISMSVPESWVQFARDYGLSVEDVDRLAKVECVEGEWKLRAATPADMRTQELVILLNDAR